MKVYNLSNYLMVLPEDSTDNMIRHCIDLGNPNLDKVELILSLLAPNSKILDIGANIGTISLPLASAGHNVISIEGLPSNYTILKNSIDINKFNNMSALNLLASDKNGTEYIHDYGACSFVKRNPNHIDEASDNSLNVCVPSQVLDEVLTNHTFDLIKIDIEGSEMVALKGMKDILQYTTFILFESNRFALEDLGYTSPKELFSYIQNSGFDIYLIDDQNNLRRCSTILDGQINMVVDYLAVKQNHTINKQIHPEYTAEELLEQLELFSVSTFFHQRGHIGELIIKNSNASICNTKKAKHILNRLSNDDSAYVRHMCGKP